MDFPHKKCSIKNNTTLYVAYCLLPILKLFVHHSEKDKIIEHSVLGDVGFNQIWITENFLLLLNGVLTC